MDKSNYGYECLLNDICAISSSKTGWASSGDFMQGTSLKFASQEDAVAFAEKQGWDYFLQTPHMQEFHPKSYSTNFTKTHMNPAKSMCFVISEMHPLTF